MLPERGEECCCKGKTPQTFKACQYCRFVVFNPRSLDEMALRGLLCGLANFVD